MCVFILVGSNFWRKCPFKHKFLEGTTRICMKEELVVLSQSVDSSSTMLRRNETLRIIDDVFWEMT